MKNNKDIPMTDEEQLKRQVKQQKTLIATLFILVACLSVLLMSQAISIRKLRVNEILLHRMESQVEQMEIDFQKTIKAIESKAEAEK